MARISGSRYATDAEDQPSAAQYVEARDLFGEDQRVSLGKNDDAGAQLDPLGVGGHVGEGNQGVEDRFVRLHRRGLDPRRRDDDVLVGPEGVVAEALRQWGDPRGRLRRRTRVGVDREEADRGASHGREPYAYLRDCPVLVFVWNT
jgi:hypothetical protein